MKRLILAAAASLLAACAASAAPAPNQLPSIPATNGTVRATPSAIIVPIDPANPGGAGCVVGATGCTLATSGGGGGGGGAVTIADGADATQGAIGATAATAGGTGTVSAKLRLMTTQLNTIATNTAAASGGNTGTSYVLLNNTAVTGPSVGPVIGGGYVLPISGTFGGTSIALNQTVNGITTTYATYTSAPSTAPCLTIGQGTTLQAVVTGGSPSGLRMSLNGVASCASDGGASNALVATAAPAYSDGTTQPQSMTPTGDIRTYDGAANISLGGINTGIGATNSTAWAGTGAASLNALLRPIATAALDTNPASVNLTQLAGGTIAANAGNASAQTQRVVIASDQLPVTVRTALRSAKGSQFTTITSSASETTIVTAGGSGVFRDIYMLTIANTSASDATCAIKSATGGGTVSQVSIKAGATSGFALEAGSAFTQASSNNNWTATCSSVSSLMITALYITN